MAIDVQPSQPVMVLASVRLVEQRTYGSTVYPTIERTWQDGEGNTVRVEVDAPQVQLNLDEWPGLKAAHDVYTALLEQAAAYRLGYVADPGQTYTPPPPPEPLPEEPAP